MTKGRTLLSNRELEICTILRMNRDYMRSFRENHPSIVSKMMLAGWSSPEVEGGEEEEEEE